jgi:hypothetical protein
VREYPDHYRRLPDGGNDLEFAATLRAVFEVDIEHALEQARPTHARRRAARVFARRHAGMLSRAQHDRGTQPGIGREHPARNGSGAGAGAAPARPTRCMNSSGDSLMCVAPSRHALLSCSTTSPAPSRSSRSKAIARRVM